jgi:hypothetical protein
MSETKSQANMSSNSSPNGGDSSPRSSYDGSSTLSNRSMTTDHSVTNSDATLERVYVPTIMKLGYLMRKSGFLKRWSKQFCVLDRFSLSCYDSEQSLRSGHQPDDIIKLHGSSVYDGGHSLTLKSTRIHISTEDGRLHCFSSKNQKDITEWMNALYDGIEHLSTIDFGPKINLDDVDDNGYTDDVGIGSRRHLYRGGGKRKGNGRDRGRGDSFGYSKKRHQLRRTVSQYVRQSSTTSAFSPRVGGSGNIDHINLPPKSPRRKTHDDERWEKWTKESHFSFKQSLDRTSWIRLYTKGNITVHVGQGSRVIYKATCMMRAAPETVAQLIKDSHTRGLWDAQFPIANVVDKDHQEKDAKAGRLVDDVPVVLHLQSTNSWNILLNHFHNQRRRNYHKEGPLLTMILFAIAAGVASYCLPNDGLISAAVMGAAIIAALRTMKLSCCFEGRKLPRDLCVVQCVRHLKTGDVIVAEHSIHSLRCPKSSNFIRAKQSGCGFYIESVSMNGWPAARYIVSVIYLFFKLLSYNFF